MGPGFESLKVHQKKKHRSYLCFFFWYVCKGENPEGSRARAANGRDALPRLPKGNGNSTKPATLRRGDPACGVSADTLKVQGAF